MLKPKGFAIALLIIVTLLFLHQSADEPRDHTSAPFTARLGHVAVRIPKNSIFQRPYLNQKDGIARFDLCSPEFGVEIATKCNPFGGEGGVHVFLHAPKPWTQYTWIKERADTDPPPMTAMRAVRLDPEHGPMGPPGPTENYQLSRVLGPFSRQLATTDREWPISACGVHSSGKTVSCGAGFRINDMFVEAHWTLLGSAVPTQPEVWATMSELDRKIRGLIVREPMGPASPALA